MKSITEVASQDVLAVDWTTPRYFRKVRTERTSGKKRLAWIMSPPAPSGGGHQNIFMFIAYLEKAGFEIEIFYYAPNKFPRFTIDGIRASLSSNSGFSIVDSKMNFYDPDRGLEGDFDGVVASDWPTAYAAWRYPRDVPRIYWILDFEPMFFPAGSKQILAMNTYRFGYQGIAIGPWLASKVEQDFKMECLHYNYAVDSNRYPRTNIGKRDEVLFYARPSTARRAAEFGFLVLEELHRLRPEIKINLVGEVVKSRDVNFPFLGHGILDVNQLSGLYNRCASALVLSMTSVSLLPLELASAGVVPIVNDGENTRESLQNDVRVKFVQMSPKLMAQALLDAVDDPNQAENSLKISLGGELSTWDQAGAEVVDIFNELV